MNAPTGAAPDRFCLSVVENGYQDSAHVFGSREQEWLGLLHPSVFGIGELENEPAHDSNRSPLPAQATLAD